MTEKKQSQRHWTIAKTAAREAKIAAAIERTGVKGFTALVDRLLDMEAGLAESLNMIKTGGLKYV